jgi:phage tail sheath gpL-like
MVRASAFAANICTLTALVGGVAGDAVATVETFTAGTNVFGAAVLGSGADCTATDAVAALVDAIITLDTQGVGAVDSTGGVVTLTADAAGDDGNAIAISETMLHGAFAAAATHLSGGVDGSDAPLGTFMVDATYLYVLVGVNDDSGKNWRKVALSAL